MENSKRWGFLRDAWRLAKPYWFSDDKKWAWGLLAAVIALNLGAVYLNVRLNYWRGFFISRDEDARRNGGRGPLGYQFRGPFVTVYYPG